MYPNQMDATSTTMAIRTVMFQSPAEVLALAKVILSSSPRPFVDFPMTIVYECKIHIHKRGNKDNPCNLKKYYKLLKICSK